MPPSFAFSKAISIIQEALLWACLCCSGISMKQSSLKKNLEKLLNPNCLIYCLIKLLMFVVFNLGMVLGVLWDIILLKLSFHIQFSLKWTRQQLFVHPYPSHSETSSDITWFSHYSSPVKHLPTATMEYGLQFNYSP